MIDPDGHPVVESHESRDATKNLVAFAPFSTYSNNEVGRIKSPTLVSTASQDPITPPKMGSSFFEARNATLIKKHQGLGYVGHNALEEDGARHDTIVAPVLSPLDEHGR